MDRASHTIALSSGKDDTKMGAILFYAVANMFIRRVPKTENSFFSVLLAYAPFRWTWSAEWRHGICRDIPAPMGGNNLVGIVNIKIWNTFRNRRYIRSGAPLFPNVNHCGAVVWMQSKDLSVPLRCPMFQSQGCLNFHFVDVKCPVS